MQSIDASNRSNLNHDDLDKKQLIDVRLNLYNAIKLRRNDIVVSLINEWFKKCNNFEFKYFFNECFCDNNSKTALHLAFELNDCDIVRTLLNFNADPSLKDKINNKNLVELVISSKNHSMKQILYDSLLQAVAQNNLDQIKKFIHAGIDINCIEYLINNNSYLHWAVLYSNDTIIKYLLNNGANVNILNKNGETPLHDAVYKRKDLNIIELFLLHKADVNIKAIDGPYKNKSPLELSENNENIHNFIHEFVNETLSEPPISPNINEKLIKDFKTSNIEGGEHFEEYSNYCLDNTIEYEELHKLLWPRPQIVQINDFNSKFHLTNDKTFFVYVKPPNTYKYIDFINRLTNVYSDIKFSYINKDINEPFIAINIDNNLFHIENSYSILIKKNLISIDAFDIPGLQYALCTLLQLCKIYANYNIPEMKIIDYPNIKNRGVMIDLSQGFYLKYTYLLSIIQTLTFFKLNQIHFYVKFSSLCQDKKQWYHYIEHWFNLIKFCDDFNLKIVPTVDISSDIADLDEIVLFIKEYLSLFKTSKFVNIGPRLSSLLICMEDKNPFLLDLNQYLMLSSYLYHNNDEEINNEIEKFDKLILMEYGLKVGHDFDSKCQNLNKSGKPFYLCVGSANWNSLFGCPDGSLYNLFKSIKNISQYKPLGILLCEFNGVLMKTSFSFNINSIFMFAGPSWNHNIDMKHLKADLPNLLNSHGLITEKDGQIGCIMLELGHIETYLTRKMINMTSFDDLPLDNGSVFTKIILNPDDIELENFDLILLKKLYAQVRRQQLKMKSILNDNSFQYFKEVYILIDLGLILLKLLIAIFNIGGKQQNNTIGFNVINIGVSNLPETVKTDLANKLISIKEELEETWKLSYYEESIQFKTKLYENLIEKLLNQIKNVKSDNFHSIYFKDIN